MLEITPWIFGSKQAANTQTHSYLHLQWINEKEKQKFFFDKIANFVLILYIDKCKHSSCKIQNNNNNKTTTTKHN